MQRGHEKRFREVIKVLSKHEFIVTIRTVSKKYTNKNILYHRIV